MAMASGSGILIVHEDAFVRVVVAEEIEEYGWPVWATANEKTAHAWAKEQEFELALVDARATDFDPVHVARLLHLLQANVPVAFFGAPGEAPSREFPIIGSSNGMEAFIASIQTLVARHGAHAAR